MSKSFLRSVAAFALFAVMLTGSAWAQGRGHSRGANQGWRMDRGDRGVWRGDNWGLSNNSRRPPGWDHGRKTGWGDCDVPPGQAKKMGCNSGFGVFNGPVFRDNRYRTRDYDGDRFRRDHDRDRDRFRVSRDRDRVRRARR